MYMIKKGQVLYFIQWYDFTNLIGNDFNELGPQAHTQIKRLPKKQCMYNILLSMEASFFA